jgi:lauroyl/myristoyl acyltransferase
MTAPWAPRSVPWGGVLARVRASVGARRLVPTGVAMAGTDLLYEVLLRVSRARMSLAIQAMDAVLGGTLAETELHRQARRHIAARARGWELTWRPWELERIPVRGLALLERVRSTGRGLMISKSHLGPLAGWVPLGRLLRPLLLPADEWLLGAPNPGYDGYRVEHRRKIFHDCGIELVHATNSALRLYRALRDGGVVLLSMDMPGPRRTQFLGKPVDLVDGTAQLAARTDALVLPAALMPLGRRWEIQLLEPLDPRDFASPDELHLALASVHEELIMRAPEHLESPLWRWEQATRSGWYRQ